MKTVMNYLEFYKTILDRVSFDSFLLKKEYEKACKHIPPEELSELKKWMNAKGIIIEK